MSNPKRGDWNWRPPADWTVITTIDMHTGGEPLRGGHAIIALTKLAIESSRVKGSCVSFSVPAGRIGPYRAIIPEISGTAHITGSNEFWFDPDDPLSAGFILR